MEQIKCRGCGKMFEKSGHPNSRNLFCTFECFVLSKKRVASERIVCAQCGKEFSAPKWTHRKMCSTGCRENAKRGNTRVRDFLHGRWSFNHDKCIACGTTSRPHYGHGLCELCDVKIRHQKKCGTFGASCAICGESRVVDGCHIVSKREGGPVESWNMLPLCPTHHKLFDRNEMNQSEYSRIEAKVKSAWERKAQVLNG